MAGTSGPYVDRPSFDFIAQAMSGFMAVNSDQAGLRGARHHPYRI